MVRLASAERRLNMLCGTSPSSALRVLSLLLGAVLLFAQAPPAGNKEVHEIDRYIQGEIKLNQIPGLSMAIVRGRVVLSARAYGVGSLATGEPMTVDTPMELASLSKPFTALAVLQLARTGWLDLDRPVRLYLPEFCPRENEPCAQITARHLLRHTSGFRRRDTFLVPCCGQPGEYDLSLAVRDLRAVRLIGRPGSFFGMQTTTTSCWPRWWSGFPAKLSRITCGPGSSCPWG